MKETLVLTGSLLIFSLVSQTTEAAYTIGVGRADCTGPSAEITFMGYAKATQKGCGIHLRQYSRAYIFDDGSKRVLFVTVDACMMNHGIRKEVISRLSQSYNDTYTFDNVVISGTHTHSTPGGFMEDVMYDVPALGFVKETFDALVDGIVRSIRRAHNKMVDARIFINSGEVDGANINRSPASYLFNPEEERQRYAHNTDKELVQMKFVSTVDNRTIGAINWYAVHPTSMNNTNCLVSTDNVGYASILLETSRDPDSLPGQGQFVGAFASTNLGDVSPNTDGPRCQNTGERCDNPSSTCNGEAKYCVAAGPGHNIFESTDIIARMLYDKATELLTSDNSTEVTGEIRFIHQFVRMPNQTAQYRMDNGTVIEVRGCAPAMGYSFAAGTTDGPGEFDFTQATKTSNTFWNLVRDFIFPPTPDDVACHAPKPILIMSGNIKIPYEWQPEVVSTQILMIGNAVLAPVSGEFTTMSGRRLRDTVRQAIVDNGGPSDARVILCGLSNVYTSYIATYEEYQLQRYEGASTIYGPHTLTIYLKLYKELASNMMNNVAVTSEASPYQFPKHLLGLVPPVIFDSSGWFFNFGDCIQQPPSEVTVNDTVVVKFISGHPRNNLLHESTFLTVEKYENGKWKVIATDSNWETKFIWRRTDFVKGSSEAEIRWHVTGNVEPGTYRISHFGFYKYILGGVFPYDGTTRNFTVRN
ncbi:unnamed protein product [Phaedon cochleariae]|uniref:Neutral ceramidase n=1 Tax=Phaedon cochleariae TaxID=80249 RepID=A0A9P0DM27_PHACE|nr:unnamed protein product [Phaedon cochleariae]